MVFIILFIAVFDILLMYSCFSISQREEEISQKTIENLKKYSEYYSGYED